MNPVVFLVQATIVVGLPPLLWYCTPLRRVLPLVVFQVLIGIALGPSLLGWLAPDAFAALFPRTGFVPLVTIANLAIVLFAFALGAHLDFASLTGRGRSFAYVSAGSIGVPVLLGVVAGYAMLALYPGALGPKASGWEFASGIGICIGVTALPVLAAILVEMRLLQTRIGQQALGCAAVNDAALWALLAVLLAANAEQAGHGGGVWLLALGSAAYFSTMGLVVKPLLQRLADRVEFNELQLILVCMLAFASAAITEVLGLHMILGALVAGLCLPKDWRPQLLARIEMMTGVVLLPFFFILTGLRTTIDFSSESFAGILAISSVAAVIGKVAGTAIPARVSGESWNDSLALGALLQTKGLMEVVALTVLLEAGIISPTTFSAMVAMAVLTTALAAPLARLAWSMNFGGPHEAGQRTTRGRAMASEFMPGLTRTGATGGPELSVLIISWNDWPKLQACLASLMRSSMASYEIIVVDNASSNGTPDRVQAMYPGVRLIRNAQNVGHTRAVNQAFGLATGNYILLLDSDTELEPDCVSILHDYLVHHPDVDLVAPRTFNTDGSVQETARNFPTPLSGLFGRQTLLTRWFPNNPISGRYLQRGQLDHSEPFPVQQVGGACMFFRRELLDVVGPWDTSYFGYWVDTDWCYQLHAKDRRVVCVPAARMVHHESNARGKRKSAKRIWIFHYGAYQLYTRWHTRGPWDPRAILAGAALLASAGLKAVMNVATPAEPVDQRANAAADPAREHS